MDEHKISNFKSRFREEPFPAFSTHAGPEAAAILGRLSGKLHTPLAGANGAAVLEALTQVLRPVPSQASDDSFSLLDLLSSAKIQPRDYLFVNWRQFESIDRFRSDDLDRHFKEIWYPSVDDIEIFDESYQWVLRVEHDGTTSVAIL